MIRTSSLFAAFVLFFWMFLAADPLEQLAGRDGFRPASHDTRELALTHAALWRHGMAGNSPLYMPGFFAVAVAAWSWAGGARGARDRRPSRMLMEGAAVLVLAAIAATTMLAAGGATIVGSFERQFALRHEGFLPAPSLRATMLAAYTLCTWTIFVFCCRRALASRSWRPLWPVPPMTLVLTLVRTWTLGDVWRIWARVAEGDPHAVLSSLAIPMVVGWMLRTELTSPRPRAAAPAPADGDARQKSARGRLSGQPR